MSRSPRHTLRPGHKAPRTLANGVFAVATRVLAILTLALIVLPSARTEARLHPYYVLSGASFGQVEPRILFVLDTSGSMAWESKKANRECTWLYCEDGTDYRQSRIASARKAIRKVVNTHKDKASFALMTFDKRKPPNSGGQVPAKCKYANKDERRFYWVESYYGNKWIIANKHGFIGQWMLCGDNRPYPYLRWDDLGLAPKVTANNQTGTIPDSPLHSEFAAYFASPANSFRKVQWFPKFMGIRINLNSTTDPDEDILDNTYGDYGNNASGRKSNVWGHDFYYWPYVDGFPGYSRHYWQNKQTGRQQLGVHSDDTSTNAGALVAPFYFETAIKSYTKNKAGPASQQEAEEAVLAFTDHIERGGVDVGGGTPWKSTIGPIVASPPSNNAIFSHSTVASYLRFTQNIDPSNICAPLVTVLITDGDPSANEGGSQLHKRLAALRNTLNSKVYVIGFTLASTSLNNMACASAGSDNISSPCSGTPTKAWDTCYDPTQPGTKCAWLASSPTDLANVITQIVEGELAVDIPGGPGSSITDFGASGSTDIYQSSVEAHTEWPGWRGHVERAPCTTMIEDPPGSGTMVLAPECATPPVTNSEETFGPCPESAAWDAGTCLELTNWKDRRVYINDASNDVHPVYDPGTNGATPEFRVQLNDLTLGVPGAPFTSGEADAIARFIQGNGWKDDWKLPGLANSAPVVVRRIPKPDPQFAPQVAIRDPHCAGRTLSQAVDVDKSLVDFAADANDPALRINVPSPHWEYQEAVLVGDDLGLIHAFQYQSGNELFAFLPRFLLASAVESYGHGGSTMGQPDELEDHVYGAAGTANHGWVHDPGLNGGSGGWRHIAVIGVGEGGRHYVALDVSHMSPASTAGPVEVLWTTDDPGLRTTYAPLLGEAWARPALTYRVPNDLLSDLPEAYLVMGSGYPSDIVASAAGQGRNLILANALTGQLVERTQLPSPSTAVYESSFGAVTDPAVGTYCASRYWGEMQETYITDPAGRLFRWDLGRETSHASDSGGTWGTAALPVATFRACASTAEFSCSVSASNKGDAFSYPPAVVAKDRIDDDPGATGSLPDSRRNQFLVAMISGSPFDDAVDGGDPDNDFHSSIYVLADDHRTSPNGGFDIPSGAPKAAAGSQPGYFRLALSDIERTRVYTPYPGSPTYTETRTFSKRARPIRAPRILVSRIFEDTAGTPNDPTDDTAVDGAEIYYIQFTVYEPSTNECSEQWYDPNNQEFVFDAGSTYELMLSVASEEGKPFDFTTSGASAALGGLEGGLSLHAVRQVLDDDCADGVCGPKLTTKHNRPCNENSGGAPPATLMSLPVTSQEIDGFNPTEVTVP